MMRLRANFCLHCAKCDTSVAALRKPFNSLYEFCKRFLKFKHTPLRAELEEVVLTTQGAAPTPSPMAGGCRLALCTDLA
jgi:hypothetical protein